MARLCLLSLYFIRLVLSVFVVYFGQIVRHCIVPVQPYSIAFSAVILLDFSNRYFRSDSDWIFYTDMFLYGIEDPAHSFLHIIHGNVEVVCLFNWVGFLGKSPAFVPEIWILFFNIMTSVLFRLTARAQVYAVVPFLLFFSSSQKL